MPSAVTVGCPVRCVAPLVPYDGPMVAKGARPARAGGVRAMTAALPRVQARPAVPPLALLASPAAWVGVVAASAVLGVVMSRSAALATLHLAVTLAGVVAMALFARRPDIVLAGTLYAGMCDVLWRSSSARGPYEGAKYALVLGFALLAVRFIRHPRNLVLCGALALTLVPGALEGAYSMGLGEARQALPANLAGLLAVVLAVLVCSNLRVSAAEVRGLYLVVLSPVVGLVAQATESTITAAELTFTDEVSFVTSGGFGPNQVSSVLCLGGLLCILVMLQREVGWTLRLLALATGVWLVGQAVLTFSRGGLFALVLAAAAIVLVALTEAGQRARVIVATVMLVAVAMLVLSWAGAFTGGKSEERLSSTDTTNRTDIARADVDLFLEEPLAGVGVGMSRYERAYDKIVAPHTEYTRLLAEHGLFGVAALVLLGIMCVRIVRGAQRWHRMAAAGLLVMALAQMVHSATRVGALGVAFGLAALLGDDGG